MAKKTKKGKINVDRERCKGCHICVQFCPRHLIEVSDKLNQKGYYPAEYRERDVQAEDRQCTGCTMCALVCPDIAIEVYRE